jgi:hypothetical protein
MWNRPPSPWFFVAEIGTMIYTAPRPKGLAHHGMPWTPEQLNRLRELSSAKTPAETIAQALERSPIAIRAKATALGLKLARQPRRQGR